MVSNFISDGLWATRSFAIRLSAGSSLRLKKTAALRDDLPTMATQKICASRKLGFKKPTKAGGRRFYPALPAERERSFPASPFEMQFETAPSHHAYLP
jgi:hypothetical protein